MSKVKSGVGADNGADVVEQPDTTEVAALNGAGTAVAVRPPMGVGQFDLGDDPSSGDAARPMATVHIAHNLSESEPEGTVKGSVWLSRKSDLKWPCKVADLGRRFNFIPFSVSHSWREVVPYGQGLIPREFASKQEADAAGMITEFQPSGSGKMRNCVPVYTMWVLIEAPDGVKDNGFFYLSLGGKLYAPAQMFVDKYTSYVSLKTTLQSAAQILSAKFGVPLTAVDMSAITLCARTEMYDKKVQSNTRKIPYLVYDAAKDQDGVVLFTSDAFRKDLKRTLASMGQQGAATPDELAG
jgi:hypothetical protein